MLRTPLLVFSFILFSLPALAQNQFVDPVGGNDQTGDGSRGRPWKTVTIALSESLIPGSKIFLAAGTYSTQSGETLPLVMQPGVSLMGAGFDATRIEGPAAGGTQPLTGTDDLIVFPDGLRFTKATRIVGLTLAQGRRGIVIETTELGANVKALVRGVAISDCEVGIWIRADKQKQAAPFLFSTYLHDNLVGIDSASTDGHTVTLASNLTVAFNGVGYRHSSPPMGVDGTEVYNSIFWNNDDDLDGLTVDQVFVSDIEDNDFGEEGSNLSVDPSFVDAPERNLRLSPGSPLIDRGFFYLIGLDGHDPDFEPREFDGLGDGIEKIDIGADEAGDPKLMARSGDVNARLSRVQNTLLVNGSSGDIPTRRVTIGVGDPITLAVEAAPQGPAPGSLALFARFGDPDQQSPVHLNRFFGTTAFETPISGPAPDAITVINTFDHPRALSLLGTPRFQTTDAPLTLFLPDGVHVPTTVSLQGILFDGGGENGLASVMNMVVLTVE